MPHRTGATRLPLQPLADSSGASLLVRPAVSTPNPSSVASFRPDWKVFLIDLELKSRKTRVSFLLVPTSFSYRDRPSCLSDKDFQVSLKAQEPTLQQEVTLRQHVPSPKLSASLQGTGRSVAHTLSCLCCVSTVISDGSQRAESKRTIFRLLGPNPDLQQICCVMADMSHPSLGCGCLLQCTNLELHQTSVFQNVF